MEIKALIDSAAERVGGMARLAEKIGQPQSRLRDWKSGVKPCPLGHQVKLCELCGFSDELTGQHLRQQVASHQTLRKRRPAPGQTKNA